jgi:hypothetical protein
VRARDFVILLAFSLLVALAPASSLARPVTRTLDLVAGSEQFFRIGAGVLAFVDAPEVVGAEVLPSNELLLTPKAPGRALVYLMGPSTFDAVRVRVRESGGRLPEAPSSESREQAVRKTCQHVEFEKAGEGKSLSANVPTSACRKALLELFDSDDFQADRVSLIFSEDVIREQYGEILAAVKAAGLEGDCQLAYLGPTLSIKGKMPPARKLELLKIVYHATPGRLLLDDRTETAEDPKPDAGQPERETK